MQLYVCSTFQVWRDLKSTASKKASKLRIERQRTGNFPINQFPLQSIERRVISAIGLEYVQGNENCLDSCVEDDVCIHIIRNTLLSTYFLLTIYYNIYV